MAVHHRDIDRYQCRDVRRTRVRLGEYDREVPDPRTPDPAAGVDDADERAALTPRPATALAALPEKQRTAVVRRFGLDGGGERTLIVVDPTVAREANRVRVDRGLEELRAILEGRKSRQPAIGTPGMSAACPAIPPT